MGTMADDVIKGLSEKKIKGMILTTGNDKKLKKEKIPFGIDLLDDLTNGGLPYGRFTLIYGEGSVGKTFLCYKLFAMAQKLGKKILYVCIDKTFEPDWCATVGVDVTDLPILIPDYGEQAWDYVHKAIDNEVDLIVMDSLDAIIPTVIDTSMENVSYGTEIAKCNTRGIRLAQQKNHNSVLVLLNHIREGVGRFASKSIPGGKAQEDFASLMMFISRGSAIKDDNAKKIGFTQRITLEKDKVSGKQFQSCELPFIYEGGMIDSIGGLIEICLENNIIPHDRASYYLFGEKIHGKLKLREALTGNTEICDKLRAALRGEVAKLEKVNKEEGIVDGQLNLG